MGKWLLLSLLFLVETQASPPECCKGDATWVIDSKNCSDGNEITLNCVYGFYAFEPSNEPNEKYRVIEADNTTWLHFESEVDAFASYNITQDIFCLTKLTDEKGDDLVALICFPDQTSSSPSLWRETLFGMCSMISSFCLALTLLVYLILPELREVQDKAMMSVTASFMVAFFLMGNQHLNASSLEENLTCVIVAFVMYYAYLCAFFWLNIISLNIWRSVWFPSLKVRSNVLFIFYCMIGWGLPLCFLTASLLTHHITSFNLKPGFGEVSCWFNGYLATWIYFYGPILTLLAINLIYLALTSWKLWHKYGKMNCCKLQVLRFKCSMYLKLAFLMGITWIFEIVSFAFEDTNQYYWILPDILNVLQGFFIFMLFVISRKKVRKLLAKRRPFNIPFPKSWAAYEDQENCKDQAGPDELELSQSS